MNPAVIIGSMATLLQALTLFTLTGIFRRIERLEEYIMGGKWTGHERRH